MTYIIENANILKDQQITKASLLIDNGTIVSIKPAFKRYKHMKMNAEPYIMTPATILFKNEIPLEKSFQEMKTYYINEFILTGCTAFITAANVRQEYELVAAMKQLKIRLLNCPIDYILAVRVPVRLLTQSFLRNCKKEKIPAIFVDINEVEELNHIPWGWLRDAMFPYNSTLIPIFRHVSERKLKQAKIEWVRKMDEEKMPYLKEELKENHPIPKSILAKLGIFPFKASIHQGCELSYNFYNMGREIRNIEEEQLFHYHRDKLMITVHRGNVIRAGNELVFRPGQGEHVKINTPSFFKIEV